MTTFEFGINLPKNCQLQHFFKCALGSLMCPLQITNCCLTPIIKPSCQKWMLYPPTPMLKSTQMPIACIG